MVWLIFWLAIQCGQGAPGAVDTTLLQLGQNRFGFGYADDLAYAATSQGDGKVILAGKCTAGSRTVFGVIRYDTSGLPDLSFGIGGRVIAPVGLGNSQANAVRVQADGKIVVAGAVNGQFALVRYTTNGFLDLSFGSGGTALFTIGSGASVAAMVIDANGKFVFAGYAYGTGGVLARCNTNGILDTSFSGTGAVTNIPTLSANVRGMTLQADGKILLTGPAPNGSGFNNFGVVRYLANGTLDTTFNGTGVVNTPVGNDSFPQAIAIQPGTESIQNPDRIVVAGYGKLVGNPEFAVARFNLDGSLDTTFNGTGMAFADFGTHSGEQSIGVAVLVTGFAIQPRKIIVAGYNPYNYPNTIDLARFNANGSLDTTFNANGILKSFTYCTPTALLLNSGKYLVAGYVAGLNGSSHYSFVSSRFNTDGSSDTNYSGGQRFDQLAGNVAAAKSVLVQPDGNIMVAGSARDDANRYHFVASRRTPDGSPDLAFNGSGTVRKSFSTEDKANAMVLQPDGKIILAGSSRGTKNDFSLVRLAANGAYDLSFNGSGYVKTSVGASNDVINAVALQPDGKIVVAGSVHNSRDNDFGLARYTTNGTLDTSFNFNGKVTIGFGTSNDVANAIALQPDGKILAAGFSFNGLNHDFAIARFTTNGILDGSFNGSGLVLTAVGNSNDVVNAIALQPDGNIVAAGSASAGSTNLFALARYHSDGSPDLAFNGAGIVTTQIGGSNDICFAVILPPDGKILAVGQSGSAAKTNFAVVRYQANGSLDSAFGSSGKFTLDLSTHSDVGYAVALDAIGRIVVAGDSDQLFGLTRILGDTLLKCTAIAGVTNGLVSLDGFGTPGAVHTLYGSGNLLPGSFNVLGTVAADVTGKWHYDDASSGTSNRFYRLSLP